MPDAGPSVPAKSKGAVKSAKAGTDTGSDGKKRFEVKKVTQASSPSKRMQLIVFSGTL